MDIMRDQAMDIMRDQAIQLQVLLMRPGTHLVDWILVNFLVMEEMILQLQQQLQSRPVHYLVWRIYCLVD